MNSRFAISLALVLVFAGVSTFGVACETSCELGAATGNHCHRAHADVPKVATASSMDPKMDMSSMSDKMQPGTQVILSSKEEGNCVCPLAHTECVLSRSSVNSSTTPIQFLDLISILPTTYAMAGRTPLHGGPPGALMHTCALRI
jgi:hypothetical protein